MHRRRKRPVEGSVKRLLLLAVCIVFALPVAAQTQQSPDELRDALEAEGFENLSVTRDSVGGGLSITYENRRYRWEIKALGIVLAKAAAGQEGRLTIIPLYTGVPMARIEVDAADYRRFLNGELSKDELFSRLAFSTQVEAPVVQGQNSSFGKVDFTLSPGVRVNLITPAPPGMFHGGELRINPGVFTSLWRGLTFEGTYTYPFSSSNPVISRAAACCNSRVGKQGFFQLQVGRLGEDLSGLAAQSSFVSENGQHEYGLMASAAAYTGEDRTLSYQGFYTWRPTNLDLTATLSAGRYLEGDTGYSARVVSGYGERNIEFFVTRTSLSRTTGAGFTIPLGTQRQPYPGPVRLRFRNAFRFIYTDEKPMYNGGLLVPFVDGYQVAHSRFNRAYLRVYAQEMREAGASALPASAAQHEE
ncbi:MAG TPA: hypothetical protein VHR86_00020 [Armatimonadota bacterium]|nr:hypothetical protein [Armatimonadota bacterium]